MHRPRLKKWAKWTCTLAAGAAVVVAVGSRFYWCRGTIFTKMPVTTWWAELGQGLLLIGHEDAVPPANAVTHVPWEMGHAHEWYWGTSGEMPANVRQAAWHPGVFYLRYPSDWSIGTSLLYPVALTLLPTALLWYADRRRAGPGHCGGCGYDRAGLLATAPCPECGRGPKRNPPAGAGGVTDEPRTQ